MVMFLLFFFALQSLVLFCCLAAGDDEASRYISDKEQIEFLKKWMKERM